MPLMRCTPIALILTLILVAGCAGVKPAPRVVVEDTHTIVRLDVDQSIKGPDDPDRYAHPAEIALTQLQTIFGAIQIQAKRTALQKKFLGHTAKQQVFRADETAKLAPIVRDAFAQASPQERILFALRKPMEGGAEVTVGEMYIKDQQLHFILECFQRPSDSTRFISECQSSIAPQGFELSLTRQEFFVSFGKPRLLLGNSTKELVIDFSGIPKNATSDS